MKQISNITTKPKTKILFPEILNYLVGKRFLVREQKHLWVNIFIEKVILLNNSTKTIGTVESVKSQEKKLSLTSSKNRFVLKFYKTLTLFFSFFKKVPDLRGV